MFAAFIIIAYFSSVIACVHILLSVTRSATFQLSWSKLFDSYQQKNVNFSNFIVRLLKFTRYDQHNIMIVDKDNHGQDEDVQKRASHRCYELLGGLMLAMVNHRLEFYHAE